MTGDATSCARMEEAISARADGEDPGMDVAVLDAHLERCRSCRWFASEVETQRRRLRVRAADDDALPLAGILDAVPPGPAPRPGVVLAGRPLRPALAAGLAATVVLVMVAGYFAGGLLHGGSSGGSGGVQVTQVAGSDQANPLYPGATVYPNAAVLPKPDISLTDTEGASYDVARATRGRVTLVYFGYTHCPDVCPINMALTAEAIRRLPAAQRRDVTVVFVTTDPERDTSPVIRAWLDKFDVGLPPFVGLRGSMTQIRRAEKQIHMALSYAETVSSGSSDYQVVHAGYVLIYSQDGRAHLQVDYTETVADYAATLGHLVRSGFQVR